MGEGFDPEAIFNDDYLYFSAQRLGGEATEAEVELLWRLAQMSPGDRVLDLACGHGRMANRLAERGAEVIGLDATASFLDLARLDAEERCVSVEYVQGDMRHIPWSSHFDVSWSRGSQHSATSMTTTIDTFSPGSLRHCGRGADSFLS